VIHKDALALLLPPLTGREPVAATLYLSRQGERRPAHLVETPAALNADEEMHPARAGGLGPTDQPKIGEDGARELRDLAHLRPLDAGHRIEVHPQLVRMIEVLGADRVRVQLETGQVREPHQ